MMLSVLLCGAITSMDGPGFPLAAYSEGVSPAMAGNSGSGGIMKGHSSSDFFKPVDSSMKKLKRMCILNDSTGRYVVVVLNPPNVLVEAADTDLPAVRGEGASSHDPPQ